jgi:sulfur carrier protein
MIEIIVNGAKQNITSDINIKEMIKELNYTKEGFAVAINESFIAIKSYESTIIQANDRIEILAPVQGG